MVTILISEMSEQKLLTLLQQKRGYFETILDLTKEESHLKVPDWITNLEQKRVLLNCIDEIDQEIHVFQAAFANLSQEATEELDKIRGIVKNILKLDTHNTEKRKQQLDECQ